MAQYAIGIDLGTSNCALAFCQAQENQAPATDFSIPQYQTLERSIDGTILPSFAYALTEDEGNLYPRLKETGWLIGEGGRTAMADTPTRVIHSAKSWLCHSGVDREAPILPWGSNELANSQKLSPVAASARYLSHLRAAWDQSGRAPFSQQQVTVTVPASFDQVAQRLTLEAIRKAGFPETTRLLEEPQAAFLSWIAAHPDRQFNSPTTVLVCDVGGGTTDFSLFRIEPSDLGMPDIERIAVSDHILLGGDNIDLAITHLARTDGLSGPESVQWIAEARRIKESFLSDSATVPSTYRMAVSGTGSSLIANTQSVEIGYAQLEKLIFDGFIPNCDADTSPAKGESGLSEIGLPYAKDPAITRHLAQFVQNRQIDAVLFNGGTVYSRSVQQRILGVVQSWQPDHPISHLESMGVFHAVSRGAAHYGQRLLASTQTLIRSGNPRPILLEIEANKKAHERHLLCVLPKGAMTAESIQIKKPTFALTVNRPVEFRPFTGPDSDQIRQGQIVRWRPNDFSPLPPLQTRIHKDDKATLGRSKQNVEVTLEAMINELGLVQIACCEVGKKNRPDGPWALTFDLRRALKSENQLADFNVEPIDDDRLQAYTTTLDSWFDASILKTLEKVTGQKRKEWPIPLLRIGFDTLIDHVSRRSHSEAYETGWWIALGYCIRPGFGSPLDDFRMEQLETLLEIGFAHSESKAVQEQSLICWRRAAAGLNKTLQCNLYDIHVKQALAGTKRGLEAVKLLVSLERIEIDQKTRVAEFLIGQIAEPKPWNAEAYLWCLQRLLARHPFHAGSECVMPARATLGYINEILSRASTLPKSFLEQLLINAARITKDPAIDLPKPDRDRLIEQAQRMGLAASALEPLREFAPIRRTEIQQQFGEALPVGLRLI
ncbi:MAG: hsp70 family protein [Opitutales bacterium]|nr:hsp70 family protein [Opitutales bacterium]NRA26971.1 Hsp70 family protein [Opitutales bacterium]